MYSKKLLEIEHITVIYFELCTLTEKLCTVYKNKKNWVSETSHYLNQVSCVLYVFNHGCRHHKYSNKNVKGFRNVPCEMSDYKYLGLINKEWVVWNVRQNNPGFYLPGV